MNSWELVADMVCELVQRIAEDLAPSVREDLCRRSIGVATAKRASGITYGPFCVTGLSVRTRRVERVNYDLAGILWLRERKKAAESFRERLMSDKGLSREAADSLVYHLSREIVEGLLRGNAPEKVFYQLQKNYSHADESFANSITCHLYGCALMEGSFQYKTDYFHMEIRRPTRKEITRSDSSRFLEIVESVPDSIMYIMTDLPSFEARKLVGSVVSALALYRAGCVRQGPSWFKTERLSTSMQPFVNFGSQKSNSKMFIRLWDKDFESLAAFLTATQDVLPSNLVDHDDVVSPLKIGAEAYLTSLLRTSPWESQVAEAVMCIEALLMGDGPTDLRFKAAFRLGKLAGVCGCDPVQSRDLILLAYDIRSAYVHGGRCTAGTLRKIKKAWRSEAFFCQAVCDVVRSALLGCLMTKVEKKELQTLLDDAMMEETSTSRLKSIFKPVREINQPFGLHSPFLNHLDWLDNEGYEAYELHF